MVLEASFVSIPVESMKDLALLPIEDL